MVWIQGELGKDWTSLVKSWSCNIVDITMIQQGCRSRVSRLMIKGWWSIRSCSFYLLHVWLLVRWIQSKMRVFFEPEHFLTGNSTDLECWLFITFLTWKIKSPFWIFQVGTVLYIWTMNWPTPNNVMMALNDCDGIPVAYRILSLIDQLPVKSQDYRLLVYLVLKTSNI